MPSSGMYIFVKIVTFVLKNIALYNSPYNRVCATINKRYHNSI